MNKTIKLVAAAAMIAMLGSCSIIKPSEKKTTTISGATATEISNTPSTSTTTPAQATPTVADTIATSTMKFDNLTALSLGGEWTIYQVGAYTIDRDEDMPYLIFEPSTGQIYANNGCNTLNGGYAVTGNDIVFSNVLSTMRMCPDVPYETDINQIISEIAPVTFKISEAGQESLLDFYDGTGKVVMRLRRGNMQFLNGQWNVESINGFGKLEAPADLFFDLGEKKLHGNTGCNIVNGDIYLDHRRANAVDFSNMITTRMACPYNSQQTAMLVALEQAASAISDGKDRVMLLSSDGNVLMTLVKDQTATEE